MGQAIVQVQDFYIQEGSQAGKNGWLDRARQIAPAFAERAGDHDADCVFVAENYSDLKANGFFTMAIPERFGGGGADYQTLSDVIRVLGRHCGSTGLSYAMHSHPVMLNVFKALSGDAKAGATVEKIAANNLVIAGTGANDWLQSNGEALPVAGGYRINAHKHFVSGGPGADVFVTSALVPATASEPEQVIHFSIPFKTPGIEIQSNWRTLGMRGTGSNDVIMRNLFLPESAVVIKRPAGQWHPMWDVIIPIAMPLIVSCYVGLAEAAADLALAAARGKAFLATDIGDLQNDLTVAQLALDDMVGRNDNLQFKPGLANTDAIFARKAIATEAVKTVVEKAAAIVGGPGFFQSHPMERIIRDIRAMHFHPLPVKRQQLFSGRRALGLEPVV